MISNPFEAFRRTPPPPNQPSAEPAVTLVIPCYNESRRLDRSAFLSFAAANPAVRLLFVDDGSRDRTWEVLQSLRRANERQVAICRLAKNAGKAEAVRAGLSEALKDAPKFIGYWDADLATPLTELRRFLSEAEARPWTDLLMGSRVPLLGRAIDRNGVRHLLGRVFAAAASRALDLRVYDTQCGAKIFRNTPVFAKVIERPFSSRWIFDVELLARYIAETSHRVKRRGIGSSIAEIPLSQWIEKGGSKLKPWDFAVSFFELVKIRQFYRGPIRRSAEIVPTNGYRRRLGEGSLAT